MYKSVISYTSFYVLNQDELNIIFKRFLGNDILLTIRHVQREWNIHINTFLIHKHYKLKLTIIRDKYNQLEIENYQLIQQNEKLMIYVQNMIDSFN